MPQGVSNFAALDRKEGPSRSAANMALTTILPLSGSSSSSITQHQAQLLVRVRAQVDELWSSQTRAPGPGSAVLRVAGAHFGQELQRTEACGMGAFSKSGLRTQRSIWQIFATNASQ
jgi:hypothetical protein